MMGESKDAVFDPAAVAKDDQLKVAGERLHLLYRQSAPASLLSFVNSLFVVWLLWGQVAEAAIVTWLLAVSLATIIRVVLFAAYYRTSTERRNLKDWQFPYAVSLLVNGAVWGIGCLLLSQDAGLEYQMGIYFFLMGMSAGAISVYSSIRWLALTTIYLLLLPMTLAFYASGETLQIIMALGCTTFMVSVLRSSKVLSDKLNQSFFLTLHLQKEKDQSETGRLKAEQAMAARGEFVASISHEIRTPLMAILGLTELLKAQEQSPESRTLVNSLSESGNQLSSLVNNVLDFSKIDEGELELHARPLSLSVVLRSIEAMFIEPARAKGLHLELITDGISNDYWYGDEQRIRQIIINIVGNALKYTEQGEVVIEAQVRPRNGGVVIAVTDTGVGISQHKLGLVFEAYHQLSEGQVEMQSSTGLGLSIAQSLARAMGGDILLASQVDHGSRFQVELPLAPCSPDSYMAVTQPAMQSKVALHGVRLLIAEDTLLTQKLIAMFVSPSGAEITFVDNGKQALLALQDDDYDVVIMDVQMPIMGGMQALQAMHAWQLDKGQPLVPVILQTADNRAETKKRALAMGAVTFLAKPYSKQSLLEAIGFALVAEQQKQPQSVMGDAQELAVLEAEFMLAVNTENKQIETALQQNDLATAKQHAHNLKGYAGLFQRQQLLQLATALEDVCEKQEAVSVALIHVDDINTWLSHQ